MPKRDTLLWWSMAIDATHRFGSQVEPQIDSHYDLSNA
jgi:hypothetical protein